jgi:hypothetical protein
MFHLSNVKFPDTFTRSSGNVRVETPSVTQGKQKLVPYTEWRDCPTSP